MHKYAPLTIWLRDRPDDRLTLTFTQVEDIIGSRLPPSSYLHEPHWRGMSPSRPGGAIGDAGWSVDALDLAGHRVTVVRLREARQARGRRESVGPVGPIATGSSDWYWEGNLVLTLARFLESEGWRVVKQADPATREHGVDLLLERQGRQLAIEVKGFPSKVYGLRHPKAGQPKKWIYPAARSYFGDMLLAVLLLRDQYPNADLGVAMPQRSTFTTLVRRLRGAFIHLGISVYLIGADGSITVSVAAESPAWTTAAASTGSA